MKIKLTFLAVALMLATGVATAVAAEKATPEQTVVTAKNGVTAAGATFPLPFYNAAFEQYWGKTDIPVSYAGIGTSRGMKALKLRQVDMAGIDVPLTAEEKDSLAAEVVTVPTALGAVEIAYNLPGCDNLRLTGELLADIYLGKITKWNDPRIAVANEGTSLPDKEIYPVFRLDGSGTTYVFTDYLGKVSDEWAQTIGTGKTVEFPKGVGAKGTPGIAGLVEKVPGAIGYMASSYSPSYNVQRAMLRNAAGNYVHPSSAAIAAAASRVDASGLITNSAAPEAYPISCFSWVVLYKEQDYNGRSRDEAVRLLDLIEWLVSPQAQQIAARSNYTPLPTDVAAYTMKQIDTITFGGKKVKR